MSAVRSLYNYLAKGRRVTNLHAKTMFKVSNAYDLVYRLRNEGVPIYTNRNTVRGKTVFSYRIGTPNAAHVHNMRSRHIARARKALYREALGL